MSQVKIYGLADHLNDKKQQLSDSIHQAIMEVLGLPKDKRAHRFINMAAEDFYMPEGRSGAYTIIEISMISGRTKQTKKDLIYRLFEVIEANVGIKPMDLEFCIYENPACNWGFRGKTGDDIHLNYKINV